MSEAPHGYVPPHVVSANTIPPDIASYLDGSDLLEKSQAVRVSTVDVEGWPHASLLRCRRHAGDGARTIRFLLFPTSGTTANLERDGRVTLTLAVDGGMGTAAARRDALTPIRTCRLRSSRRSSNQCDDTLPPTPSHHRNHLRAARTAIGFGPLESPDRRHVGSILTDVERKGERMPANRDLREFLSALGQQGQLLSITDQVHAEPDLGAAACALTPRDASPAIHFNNIAGYTGARGYERARLVAQSRAGSGLGQSATPESNSTDSSRATSAIRATSSASPTRRRGGRWWSMDINLFELMPLFRLNRGDGGYFIDKPCVVSRDPDDWNNDDVENVGVYRLHVKGRNRLCIQTVPHHDIAIHLAHAEEGGQDLPVAITIGNDPIITLMAATPMLYDQLEYKMAGAVQNEPYRVVRLSSGLDVPWGCEYVLEGRILNRQREIEGLFGEFPVTTQGATSTP
jgi:hypothetical protein